MKRIGLIVACEMNALHRRYGAPEQVLPFAAYSVLKYTVNGNELFVVESGMGEIAAAAATQMLICCCKVDLLMNFGVVGGLTEEISRHRICIVKSVVHYPMDFSQADPGMTPGRYPEYPSIYIPTDESLLHFALTHQPDLCAVVCASGDKFIGDPAEKAALHRDFGADICEMEAAGILFTCNRNHVPCLLLKMVSDGLTGGAQEFFDTFEAASDACVALLDELLHAI